MASSSFAMASQPNGVCIAKAAEYLEPLQLHLNCPERAILCRTCKYALQPDSITRHAGKHGVPAWQRSALTNLVRALQLPDPKTISVRHDHSQPHPHLAVRCGFACDRCAYRTTSRDLFGRHMRQNHDRAPKRDATRGGELLYLQSWLENGSSGYWIVEPPDPVTALDAASVPRRIRLERMHDLEQKHLGSQRTEAAVAVGGTDMTLINNWMHRTGWIELFEGVDRALMLRLTELPRGTGRRHLVLGQCGTAEIRSSGEDEAKIVRIVAAVGQALERCRDTVRHTEISIRCWLRSQTPDRPYKAPFMLTGRQSSEQKYERLLKRCVCFCFRRWRLETSTSRPASLGRPLTEMQRKALEQVWFDSVWSSDSTLASSAVIEIDHRRPGSLENGAAVLGYAAVRGGEEILESEDNYEGEDEDEDAPYIDGDSGSDSGESLGGSEDVADSDENDTDGDGEQVHPRRTSNAPPYNGTGAERPPEHLAELVLSLLHFLATEEYEDGKPSSTLLIYFSSVLGVSSDGLTFERPSNYTPKLSGLVHCIRLILLESTLPRFPYPTLGWEMRPRRGQIERLNQTRVEKMCLGSPAPMGELLSLRSYGRALGKAEGSSFRVHWSEDGQTVSWANGSLTMVSFRQIGRTVLQHAQSHCHRLMYRWEPVCDLSKIRDTLSDTTYGYSFVTDPANGLSDAYLELSRRACLAENEGLMADNDWDVNAVRQYLDLHHNFQRLLMLLISLFGGQMPRGTDLLSITQYNSPANRRGVCVYFGKIAIINQVNKARRATNKEFYVVRFLPNNVAPLFYYYLVYIRRFCCMLHRTCLRSDIETPLLFPSSSNIQEPRKTDELTKALQQYTEEAVGIAIGVRVYRQLTIAITEKHVRQISKPFNRYDDTTTEADINAVFAWQSGHRPVQRGISYALDGAFPTALQPALLQVYQWVSNEWHRFLQRHDSPPLSSRNQEDRSSAMPWKASKGHAVTRMLDTWQSSPGAVRSADPRRKRCAPSPPSTSVPRAKTARSGSFCSVVCGMATPERPNTEDTRSEWESENCHQNDSAEVGSPWATLAEIHILQQAPSVPWPGCSPIFGRSSQFDRPNTIEERRAILENIRVREGKVNKDLQSYERFRLIEYFEEWRTVGCQLCFVNTGEPQPDHKMDECRLWDCCQRARQIQRWLENLPIPRYTGGRLGQCSFCAETDAPCDEVRMLHQMQSSDSEDDKAYWRQRLESRSGLDGHCENKPVVREVIAALCSFDNQVLGRVLAEKISTRDGVNFAAENQVSFWFSGRVPFMGSWVPRALFVFEMLVWAWESYQQMRKEARSDKFDAGAEKGPKLTGWNDEDEVQSWKKSLSWWIGKCGFCAGKGLCGSLIQHPLESCHRGGARLRRTELSESIYLEGILSQGGCRDCGTPREFCDKWERRNGKWRQTTEQCQYGRLVYNTLIGLFYCEDKRYRMEAYTTLQEEGDAAYSGLSEEEIAIWLSTKLEVGSIETSQFIRTLNVWTQMVWSR